MGALSPTHWLIIIGVLVLLFGAKRLPDAARSLGRSARILKAEVQEGKKAEVQEGKKDDNAADTARTPEREAVMEAPRQVEPARTGEVTPSSTSRMLA